MREGRGGWEGDVDVVCEGAVAVVYGCGIIICDLPLVVDDEFEVMSAWKKLDGDCPGACGRAFTVNRYQWMDIGERSKGALTRSP